ncbi:hypothetical protein [Parvibaculum sp.]|jgi:hypothetical protein|uniref:hypothetical protein n=1 Tax=Parvibaculum sp. TaxID=2024848 RepID=UPI00329681D0
MSNFLVGAVSGFFICVWALNANPVSATVALIDRVRQVEVSFVDEATPDAKAASLPGDTHTSYDER